MTLSSLTWLAVIATLVAFWWNSDSVKHQALALVARHCQEQKLQLLDQTLVLRGLWPVRANDGRLRLRRRYGFEFTSTGQARYAGSVTLVGRSLSRIELAPHLFPDGSETLH